jgi:hypothetical protein
MKTWMIVLLVAFALNTVIVVGSFLYIRSKLKKLQAYLGNATTGGLPPTITLTPIDEPDHAEVFGRVATLEELGYQRVGCYAVDPMEGAWLVGLVEPRHDAWAAVAFHPRAGVFTDLFIRHASVGSLTVSNAPTGGELDQRPGHHKVFDATLVEPAMHELLLQQAGERARKPSDPAGFTTMYETAYADDMAWRLEHGGATVEEVRRIAENTNGEFGDDDIAAAQQAIEEIAEAEAMYQDLDPKGERGQI